MRGPLAVSNTGMSDWILITSEDLPTLPHVAMRLLAVVDDPMSSAADLEAVIQSDQALTQRVLRMSNSAMFGGVSTISDVRTAVARLGFNRVKNLVLIAATKDVIATAGEAAEALWRHALGVAICSHLIAEELGMRAGDDIFLSGLFHDVGQVLINNQKPARFKEIVEAACAQRRPISEVEKEVFNFSHEEVGVLILKKWKLPEKLIPPIQYHHAIQRENCRAVPGESGVAIVGTADLIASMQNIGLLTSVAVDPIDARSSHLLGLKEEQVLSVAEKLPEVFLSEIERFS